ncbi:5-hydroxytryptamine receptor 2A [Agrilus planipennis]|uniref:5-hydroxytryptamine receptor 2A n=1 Tax=Agrilus planipennis TaxID=224129 RepID=A0A1W4WFV3_AGRPL|nr:5-hydroxytryptamine receptor 2A [Agrilus planipennis]XP_018318890.1 5-hydroxytryptamine receptor 2A [Agrilus planipennis]
MTEDAIFYVTTIATYNISVNATINEEDSEGTGSSFNNWWALLALMLVLGTAAGNILVCLAITWERRLQNVTNYFLMSLAITDLMVAILVMPVGILTLVRGHFPLPAIYCLAWICLDVLFCTASIMHLCTISVDRYLSLRYPMKFGRNKTKRRVTLKIIIVWLFSIAMSLPLSLMYSKDQDSLVVDGSCKIPDPLFKFIGSIISFYVPLLVMLTTYTLTVRLLAEQKQNVTGGGWSSGWLGGPPLDRKCTWRRFLYTRRSRSGTPQHAHSATSTDTELTIDTHELWIQETEPTPCTMSALGQFGAEMLKLSRGLEAATTNRESSQNQTHQNSTNLTARDKSSLTYISSNSSSFTIPERCETPQKRRRASTFHTGESQGKNSPRKRRRTCSFHGYLPTYSSQTENSNKTSTTDSLLLPPPCTCPYFGDKQSNRSTPPKPAEIKIVPSNTIEIGKKNHMIDSLSIDIDNSPKRSLLRKDKSSSECNSTSMIVTWESPSRMRRRGSSFGSARTSTTSSLKQTPMLLRRAATLRLMESKSVQGSPVKSKSDSSPFSAQRYSYGKSVVRPHHSRNSSLISRNSSRHGRIIWLEQKATKVLGVVFFTFVILWAPFFVLNLLPIICRDCEERIDDWVFQFVTWLGYASSMVNPIFYTIFNKVFRQAFKKVLMCEYKNQTWKPHR